MLTQYIASSVFSLCQISSNYLVKGINVDSKGWSIKYKVNIVPQTLMKPSGSIPIYTVLQNSQFAKIATFFLLHIGFANCALAC